MIKHGETQGITKMETTEQVTNISKLDAFKNNIIKLSTFEEYGNRKLRRIFKYTIITILTTMVYFCLSRLTEFHPSGIWLCVIAFASMSALIAESDYSHSVANEHVQMISGVTLAITLLAMLVASLSPTYKSIEYYTPTHIYKNEQGTIVTYGTNVLQDYTADIYNSQNIKVCKTLNSNLWNVRLNDDYSICKGK